MKILLILPDGHIHKTQIGSFKRSMREAPLTLTTLAALAPPELDIEFTLIDESVETISQDHRFDLVGISVITGTAQRAYQLAGYYRSKGVPVILGGVHTTLLPDEAKQYSDYIIVGSGERLWPEFLKDFYQGKCKTVYREQVSQSNAVFEIPVARRDLQRSLRYNIPNTVCATRGCRQSCDFCSIPTVWPGYARRPIGAVVEDIQSIRGGLFGFNDVSLVDDRQYAKELFKAIIPLKKKWGGLATVKVAEDQELLELMVQSGCRYLLVGFESISHNAVKEIHKGFNFSISHEEFMKRMHSYGISIQGCFMFGFDDDTSAVFEETVNHVMDLKIDIPRYSILTPYPETKLFQRLSTEGRILTFNWENYDTMHVVFQPKQMSPESLYDGFKWAYKETFKWRHVVRRTASFRFSGLINFIGNATYRKFVSRLYSDPRYMTPYCQRPLVAPTHRHKALPCGI